MAIQVDLIEEVIQVNLIEDEVVSVSIQDGITISNSDTKVGTTKWVDFYAGDNITLSVVDRGNSIRVSISSTASGGSSVWGGITGTLSDQTDLQSALDAKQATLVSGTNIKTINGSSVLGSGNISISSSLSGLTAASATNTINNADYAQEWQWNSLTSNSGLKLSSTSTGATSNTQTVLEIAQSGANASASQTTYGLSVTNTKTGTTGTNIAGYFSASGGTSNYAVFIPSGSITLASSLGAADEISLTRSSSTLILQSNSSGNQYRASYHWFGTSNLGTTYGYLDVNGLVLGNTTSITSGSRLDVRGIGTSANKAFRVADSGNTERFYVQDNGVTSINSSSTDVLILTSSTNNRALFISSSGASGTIGGYLQGAIAGTYNAWRLQNLSSNSSATTNIDFRNNSNHQLIISLNSTAATAGSGATIQVTNGQLLLSPSTGVLVGGSTITTDALLDLQSTTKAFIPPRMTTTERDNIGTPSAGMVIYNTTTGVLNFHNGSAWGAV